jgi:hypothetical protein
MDELEVFIDSLQTSLCEMQELWQYTDTAKGRAVTACLGLVRQAVLDAHNEVIRRSDNE